MIEEEDKERENNINDFYNFLKCCGYSLNNIEPININSNGANAKFEIKLDKNLMNKYIYMQIVLVDEKSTSSYLICLCESKDKFDIETRDIRNPKALDGAKNFTEKNKIEFIKKGEEFKLNESSNHTLIDSIN